MLVVSVFACHSHETLRCTRVSKRGRTEIQLQIAQVSTFTLTRSLIFSVNDSKFDYHKLILAVFEDSSLVEPFWREVHFAQNKFLIVWALTLQGLWDGSFGREIRSTKWHNSRALIGVLTHCPGLLCVLKMDLEDLPWGVQGSFHLEKTQRQSK